MALTVEQVDAIIVLVFMLIMMAFLVIVIKMLK